MAQLGYRSRGRLLFPYIVAILICAVGGLLQQALQPLVFGRFPLAIPSIAVVVAAATGGLGPGLLAIGVSTLISATLFTRPFHYMLTDPNVVGLLLFVSLGLVVCLALSGFRRSLVRERLRRGEAEQRAGRLGDLEVLATSLLKAQTPLDICRASLPHLIQTTDASAGAIALVNDADDCLEIMQSYGFSGAAVSASRTIPTGAGTLMTEVLQRQKPVVFASQADRVRQFGALGVDALLVASDSVMVIPLLASARAVGVVALSEPHPRMALAGPRALLESAVERVACAVDRERRLARAERERADAEAFRAQADIELRERRRAEEAQQASEGRYRALVTRTRRLYALSAGLSEAATLDAVAKVIVREGKTVVGASAASVALVDGAHFETLYAEEYPRQIVEAWHHFPAESGLCATAAVQTGQPVCVGSFDEWQRLYPRSATAAADGGYLSAAALPLLVDRATIGVLSLHFTAPVNFDDEYRTLLTSVAQHAAQAIDRARAYESAQRARVESEAANRSKDDFLSIVSHELRTPLSAVLGWASMLRSRTLEPSRAARAVEAIYSNATRQTQLIDELLDVSRIVAGRIALDARDVDLTDIVRGAVETVLPTAEGHRVAIDFESPANDIVVSADPRRLEQVFVNLIGNAVKFTPPGGSVNVSAVTSGGSVDVRVADTGRGIPRAFLPQVFERFRQADSTATRSAGGLGLGLFIARRLVDAHGGSIRAESEGEGRGATFTVSLPVAAGHENASTRPPSDAAPHADPPDSPSLTSLEGVRVLIVDDDADAREVMASALETSGATVTAAASADEALELLGGNAAIDVLLSDIAMPGHDGYDLIRQVRSRSTELAAIPAAAVTACASSDERDRALAAGFQLHLAKPVLPHALVEAVASLRTGSARL
jgi:signal transduction histidine kinase/ActR/RegA family two-component response regulator